MSQQRRRAAAPNLSDPALTQMALQMMQNPEMARMMQDPRIVQTAMRMMQQQQQPPPPPQQQQLHQQMAGLQLQPGMMMPPMYMPQQQFMMQPQPPMAAAPRKSRSRAAIQQDAAERRKQKKAEKEQRKAAKKAAKRRSEDSDDESEEDDLDISRSTEVYNMWNRMLVSMIDKVIEARPADKFALEKAREFILRLVESKDAELRKQPLNELYDHLLPHHELVKNHDLALFDPELEALGGLTSLGLHKHIATLTAEQIAELWKGIELLFLLAVQIKSANSSLLRIIEATLIKAKHSTEDAAAAAAENGGDEVAAAAAAGPASFKESLNGILQGGGSGPLAAILGPMTGGAQDLESLVAQLPADVQAQVNTIVSQVEGGGEGAAAASSSGTGDLFGSYGSDAILALLRSNTIIPKNATTKATKKK
ncbi:hypothetical protein QKT49_gp381 [Acanthamoeba castellanii medusavirus]|uniref:Uncharacterized protein n=1 Tax=Acanthamoeba castellanii medusavirus J1 TaxID=3114988 RepID=A0A3T1CX19_9VIRU|nr:hypothetical protein QKT49_gp381 [Acanthamoeba castellanii medusavirus]BBI30382.1 hypothetical protein [Acanthamoeba castellanii medusavirus J1]